MKHRATKIKFRAGKDANKMLMRKLAVNFLAHGKLTTTEKKAKVLKTHLEKLVEKTKTRTEANKNYLLSNLASPSLVERMFIQVGSAVNGRVGGYVRVEKLHNRLSDGASMAKVTWAMPVVMEEPKAVKTVEKPAKPVKKEAKPQKESEAVETT